MKKNLKIVIITLLVLIISSVTVAATSDTLKELERLEKAQQANQKALDQKKKEQQRRKSEQQSLLKDIESQFGVIESRLEAGDQTIQAIYSSIGELEVEIVNLSMTLDELELNLDEKQNEINDVKLELQLIRHDKEVLHDQAKERIRVMYEYGDSGFLDVLLEADDLMEMFSRMEYINRLVDADNKLFTNLDQIEVDIVGKESELEVHEATLKKLADSALAERTVLEEKVVSKGLEVEHANDLVEMQKAYQATLEDEEQATE